jgi:acetolactate synthase-1/2/3 large subunit
LKVNASNGLVRILKEEGVEWVSTFPACIFNNACGEENVNNLMVRTERFAVAVADGYSRASNGKRFGVCSMMGGLNAAGIQMAYGALAQAYEDSSPLICLTDGVPTSSSGLERFNIEDAFKSVTKWTGYINKAERTPEFMRRAFTCLRTGRPGPVLLQLPRGLGEYDTDEFGYVPVKGWKPQGDPKDVEIAARGIISAKKPIIWAGQGIFYADACEELLRFAEITKTPVLTTLKGKSCFPEDHPLSLGVRGAPAERFLYKADLILAIGCGLTQTRFEHRIPNPSGKALIHCTIDESDVNRTYPANHAIIGDAKLVLRQLIDEVTSKRPPKKRSGLIEEIEAVKKEKMGKYAPLMESEEKPINPYRVYNEIMRAVDRQNSFVTHESGNTRDQLSTVYEAVIPHGFMGWGNVTTLGFGLGAAIGAKIAFPERQVISVTGDAGFGYQLGNYETLVRNNVGVTIVHINNSSFGGYGPGFWGPGHTPYTSKVSMSNVVKTAETVSGLGIHAERVENPDMIAPALKKALLENQSDMPAFIEAICSEYPVYGRWITD